MKKKIVFIILSLAVCAVAIIFWSAQRKQKIADDQLQQEIRSLCEFYLYDKANPGVHASYDETFHINRWRKFEEAKGPTGAKTIDEFCSHLPAK